MVVIKLGFQLSTKLLQDPPSKCPVSQKTKLIPSASFLRQPQVSYWLYCFIITISNIRLKEAYRAPWSTLPSPSQIRSPLSILSPRFLLPLRVSLLLHTTRKYQSICSLGSQKSDFCHGPFFSTPLVQSLTYPGLKIMLKASGYGIDIINFVESLWLG